MQTSKLDIANNKRRAATAAAAVVGAVEEARFKHHLQCYLYLVE